MSGRVLRRSAALLCALLAAGAMAGCGAPADALPSGVEAALLQQRSDVAAHQAQVRIRNGSDDDLVVGDVTVRDPRFRTPAGRVVDRTTTLAPGASVDVRIQLGQVDCDHADAAEPTLTLAYTVDGEPRTATGPIGEQIPFLAALHAAECLRARVEDAAAVELGRFTPSEPGEPAVLELVVGPAEAGATARVELTGVRETNLLTFSGGSPHSLALHPGADRQVVELPLLPSRCDPHAVQEDKRGTVFRVDVSIDGDTGAFDLAASPELRARILTWVADWCGYGPAGE